MHRTVSVNREREFHRIALGAQFRDERSGKGIIPFLTVQLCSLNPEHNDTGNKCCGVELDVQEEFVGTAVVRGHKDGSGNLVVKNRIEGGHNVNLDMIIVQ